MPETAPSRRHPHSHRHSEKLDSIRETQRTILEPVLYFAGAILMMIVARLMHAGLLAPALGALGIIILSISKIWKSKPGVLASIACLAGMILILVWQWISRYYGLILSADPAMEFRNFLGILTEGTIVAFMTWLFHRLYHAAYRRMGQKWFVSKTYVILVKLLFYLMLFLVLLWLTAYILQQTRQATRLSAQDGMMVAAAIALLSSGIPAIIYIASSSPPESRRRSHRHHSRHTRSGSSQPPESQ